MDFCFLRCECIGMLSKVSVWQQAEGWGCSAGVGGGVRGW